MRSIPKFASHLLLKLRTVYPIPSQGFLCALSITFYSFFQIDAVKKAHICGLLNTFKVPSQSTLRTQQEANEQAKEATHMPGQIEDLTDLLAEDWSALGSV